MTAHDPNEPQHNTSPGDSTEQSTRESRIFQSFLVSGEDRVRAAEIRRVLRVCGLREDDPRLETVFHKLSETRRDTTFSEPEFRDLTRSGLLVIEAAAAGLLIIPEFDTFTQTTRDIFHQAESNPAGHVADYIPQLSRVDPEQFGMAICTVDGQRTKEGDADTPFCIQSVSKPLNYCIALEEHGEHAVHTHMGCEPSGVSFNELALNKNGLPHNPMINAGGIMSCAMIRQNDPVADRFEHVMSMWTRLAGGIRPGFSNSVYLSERATADRNFALGYSMREQGAFPGNADMLACLEFYFQCCSLETTVDSLSVVAATLANGGLCPLTGEQVLSPNTVQSCLSLMLSCGMYNYSGEWAFRIGLPSKSGISGVVLTVVPNVLGLCTWSPRLDTQGNSVRGIEFCTRLVDTFHFHVYDGLGTGATHKIDPRRRHDNDERTLSIDLCWAASEGDCDGIQRLLLRGVDVNAADYNGRTPLHLAASEGRLDAVVLLLSLGAHAHSRDRWGNTPVQDAERLGHTKTRDALAAAD
ncbi:MAG: glutaminase A [Planctomycetota bacterium]